MIQSSGNNIRLISPRINLNPSKYYGISLNDEEVTVYEVVSWNLIGAVNYYGEIAGGASFCLEEDVCIIIL